MSLGPDGRSRGFGTVSFASEIDAERAVAMFNGLVVHYFRLHTQSESDKSLDLIIMDAY